MNFEFYMPTRVIQGKGCVRNHPEVWKSMGKKAFIVTGKSSAKKNGSQDDVTAALDECGISYEVFDEVMSNPTVEVVYRGAEKMKACGADFVIGIGGGSPMDAAKVIGLLYSQDIREEDLFSGNYEDCLPPMVMIPTTAGTGSEVTKAAVLMNDRLQTKTSVTSPLIFPKVSFLDARYMEQMGRRTTINTAVDALSHSMEGMISKKATSITNILAKESIRYICSCFDDLLSENEISLDVREKLLYGSTLGGMVIAHTGTTAVHSLGYELTYFKGDDHGRANGLLLGSFLKFAEERIPETAAQILEAMGMKDSAELSRMMDELLQEKTAMTDEEIQKFADIAMKAKNIKSSAFDVTREDVVEMYRKAR
ncbi:iron-containing alcohol dehydrogenase family protein [Clostridium sp. AM58-1XD]|uniref:iron-containing alcohol dehydrogenase family protein n=1 Tax=Clostridium sp. AM58-1XD TaxID=2292307 RepID=UPI000E4C98E1|nr:iron-containing alcohol dehydrogenase family protein [Clostridium sp. AM58-1XD]RGY98438.1 iron-containing alcohol dehydrogenase [Clostridium sp. AM58-1XD]